MCEIIKSISISSVVKVLKQPMVCKLKYHGPWYSVIPTSMEFVRMIVVIETNL
jgi:hypothetical protein